MSQLDKIAMQNPDYNALLNEMMSQLQSIAIIQLLPEGAKHPASENKELVNLAAIINKEDVQLFYQIAMMGKKDLYLAPDAKSGFEMVMIRMLAFRPINQKETPNTTMPVVVIPKKKE